MPLNNVDLKKYIAHTFVETGTFRGDGLLAAYVAGFKLIHSIDIDADNIERVSLKIKDKPGIKLYHGSSPAILPTILANLTGGVTFWLDAHPNGKLSIYPNTPERNYAPLLEELAVIKEHLHHLGNVNILIDDMRTFKPGAQKRLTDELVAMGAAVSRIDGIKADDILVGKIR